MTSRKRTREREGRIGVKWRKNRQKCVVEMRPRLWKKKLNFGSYDTEPEAMVARDYGAFLRAAAGEHSADAGGFDAEDKLYQFEESREIFESMEETKVRCDQYKGLIIQQSNELWSGEKNRPRKEFCKQARNDITVATRKFRDKYSHKLVTSRPAETPIQVVPKVELLDGGIRLTQPSSSSEVRVSPVLNLGGESIAMAEDSASVWNWSDTSALIAVAVNGSPFQILLDMKVDRLSEEEVFMTIKAYVDKIQEELNSASFEKFLQEWEPCSLNPVSIPAIDPAPKT